MPQIRVLSEELANKIAAGEVVERPASVVKELVENAIDAEARQITVELQGWGCQTIRVVDDGTGMDEDDVLLALERHATSKIHSDADLAAIRTLGFRGEALPSLAAVSRLEISSRPREVTGGSFVSVAAGVVKEVSQCGCPPGTQIRVRDLFFNQPARRKFLKGERTEFSHVVDTFTRLAMARPDIHFSLYHRGRQSHDWPAAVDLKQRLAQIFPKGSTQTWSAVSHRRGPSSIRGYLGPPELHRSNSRMLYTYVNGRSVRDRLIRIAILEAYRTLLPKGQFPVGVILLELPAETVDVNVHPTKAEVRFHDSKYVCEAVTRAARNTLTSIEKKRWARPLAQSQRLRPDTDIAQRGFQPPSAGEQQVAESWFSAYGSLQASRSKKPVGEQQAEASASQKENFGMFFDRLSIIGQLHLTYILCEVPDGMILIDQHAAHERVIFETFLREGTASPLASQLLVTPHTLQLTAEETGWLEDSLPLFERLGFTLDPFGNHTFLVRAVPAAALRQDPLVLVRDLIAAELRGVGSPPPESLLERLLQSMACRLAIKAGQRLAREEIVALLQQLEGLDYCSTCPHGRPLWWKITLSEMERIFGRS